MSALDELKDKHIKDCYIEITHLEERLREKDQLIAEYKVKMDEYLTLICEAREDVEKKADDRAREILSRGER